jgi:hypothetical protein
VANLQIDALGAFSWDESACCGVPQKLSASPAFLWAFFSSVLREFRAYFWLMRFMHHGLHIEIPDEWWTEAGMRGFVPTFTAYRVNQSLFPNAREVTIRDIGPVSRNPGAGIFNDSKAEGSARDRVVRILRGFRFDDAIPPVEIVEAQPGLPYRYKLLHGAHRFYCSLGAGFKCVPTIEGSNGNP